MKWAYRSSNPSEEDVTQGTKTDRRVRRDFRLECHGNGELRVEVEAVLLGSVNYARRVLEDELGTVVV